MLTFQTVIHVYGRLEVTKPDYLDRGVVDFSPDYHPWGG